MVGAKWGSIGYIIGSLLCKNMKHGLTLVSIHSFVHLCNKCSLRACHRPGTVLNNGVLYEQDKMAPYPSGTDVLIERQTMNRSVAAG